VLYQMLTGQVPFQGPTAIVMMHRHLTDEPPRASSKLTEIPKELDDLIFRLMAKEPADRPWDAAAVGMALTELRDKVDRGEPIEMVWSGLATDTTGRTALSKKPRKRGKSRRKSRFSGLDSPWVQPTLLVLALVVLGAFAGYMLWPPSDAYLFRKAEAMMASKDPTDWIEAQRDYVDELDQRYTDKPDKHPYAKQTQEWRDRILLHQAERRAAILERPVLGGISRADSVPEKLYLSVSNRAADDAKLGREIDTLSRWREMAAEIERQEPKQRGWILLAKKLAADLEKKIAERGDLVSQQLDRADAAERAGRFDEAVSLRQDVVQRYSSNPDLSKLIERAKLGLPPPQPPPSDPEAQPATNPSDATGR